MTFFEYNKWLWQLPEVFHILAFIILATAYYHLFYGFYLYWDRLKTHVKVYFFIRFWIYLLYVLAKAEDSRFGTLDLFFPLYLLAYIDGLIILNGSGFYRCQNLFKAINKIFKFKK